MVLKIVVPIKTCCPQPERCSMSYEDLWWAMLKLWCWSSCLTHRMWGARRCNGQSTWFQVMPLLAIYIYILLIYNIIYWPVLTDWWPYRVWLHHPTFDPSTILLFQSEGCQLPPRYVWLRRYHLGVSPKVQPAALRCSNLPCNKCTYVAKKKKGRLRYILLGQALEAFKPHGFVCVIKV